MWKEAKYLVNTQRVHSFNMSDMPQFVSSPVCARCYLTPHFQEDFLPETL